MVFMLKPRRHYTSCSNSGVMTYCDITTVTEMPKNRVIPRFV